VTSRFVKEIGKELIFKNDHAAEMKSRLAENDNSVTEVQSMSLQQQLARNKMMSGRNTQAAVEFTAGEKVQHNIFGEGTAISVTKMSYDSMLEIAFEKVGTKKLMANYAKLRKI